MIEYVFNCLNLDNVICVAKLIPDHGIVKDMKPKTGIGTNVHLTHGTEYPCCILKKYAPLKLY